MLRVTSLTTDDAVGAQRLRLDGRITGPWVDELRRVCRVALQTGQPKQRLVIDLAGVSFIDPDGIALFRELVAVRVLFTNGSAFIAQQLKGVLDVDR